MKNNKKFLASIALGFFLMAIVAPIVTADDKLEVDKTRIVIPGKKKR